MKIISIVVLWIVITLFQGCTLFENKNPLNKYEEKIKNYYLENLNDPKSYESIKTDILYQSNESTIIKHTYRTKNTFNALIKDTSYFIMLLCNQTVMAMTPSDLGRIDNIKNPIPERPLLIAMKPTNNAKITQNITITISIYKYSFRDILFFTLH